MYIGSTDGRGLLHCLWEIFDNSVDEALAGYCTVIDVILHADGSAEVRDNGRGIPVDVEPRTGLTGVELVMTRLHAGGKFGGGSYTASGGLHGVGASVVNALAGRGGRPGRSRVGSQLPPRSDRRIRRGRPGRPVPACRRAAPGAAGSQDGGRHEDQVLAGPAGVHQGRAVELRGPRPARPADRVPGARPGDPDR
jgi:hypothetical protein